MPFPFTPAHTRCPARYLTQIQALRDQVVSTQRELAEAKTTISKAGLDRDDDDDEDEEQFAAATGDWLNAQQQDTSASLDDIITRLSFGSHNSPLVKLARANLIKRRSPAARAVTARIIAETKQAADEDGISDTEVALATGEALAEVEVQFEKKHGEMVKTMRSLSDDIKMKESAMVRQSKMFASMRKLYETKMAQMDKQMRMTMQQRDKLQVRGATAGQHGCGGWLWWLAVEHGPRTHTHASTHTRARAYTRATRAHARWAACTR